MSTLPWGNSDPDFAEELEQARKGFSPSRDFKMGHNHRLLLVLWYDHDPMTDHEAARASNKEWHDGGNRKLRSEMTGQGLFYSTGETRPSDTNQPMQVWALTDYGYTFTHNMPNKARYRKW